MTRPARVAFNGLIEYLKGHIYNLGAGSQAYQFTATTKALERYAGRNFTNPQDIRITIKHHKDVTIPVPTTRTDIDKEVAKIILVKDADAYVKRS